MEFNLDYELTNAANFSFTLFLNYIVENEYDVIKSDGYNGGTITDFSGAESFYVNKDNDSSFALYPFDDAIAWVNASYGSTSVYIAGNDEAVVEKTFELVRQKAPEEEPPEDNKVYVTFWAAGQHGPVSRRRKLEIPTWDDIVLNYTSKVRHELDTLMDVDFRPGKGGQLILWHGDPGTGKTTALRALSRQWRDWCEIHYITDPEAFFGHNADYMMQVMLDSASEDKWRLLVLEDCGELLAADARAQLANPQGLSRFLNSVDGMLGQGLKFMVLVTTNEPLRKLHDAVTRPGRCISIVEFEALTAEEVLKWADFNQIDHDQLTGSKILSELFAITEDAINKKPQSRRVGF
jgi:hypothetical protein